MQEMDSLFEKVCNDKNTETTGFEIINVTRSLYLSSLYVCQDLYRIEMTM